MTLPARTEPEVRMAAISRVSDLRRSSARLVRASAPVDAAGAVCGPAERCREAV